jgi:hypothetical protein
VGGVYTNLLIAGDGWCLKRWFVLEEMASDRWILNFQDESGNGLTDAWRITTHWGRTIAFKGSASLCRPAFLQVAPSCAYY